MSGEATRDFALQIDREWAETKDNLRNAVISVATEALAKVQEKSPVADPSTWKNPRPHVGGMFRANWLLSVGSPDSDSTTESLAGFASRSAGAIASYAAAQGFPMIYLQNNLPYANRLENGWSQQAPNGVVGITVLELEAMFSRMSV